MNMLKAGTLTLSICVISVLSTSDPATFGPVYRLAQTDLVFVVDSSTSITEANFIKELNFIKAIVEYADIDSGSVRIGALIFSTDVMIMFHLNYYTTKLDILASIGKIPYIYGKTNIADALKTMNDIMFSLSNGDRDDAPNVAMVITDGVSNINSLRTIHEAIKAKNNGIQIYAVGIGLRDTQELEQIASVPSEDYTFLVQDFDGLQGLVSEIIHSM